MNSFVSLLAAALVFAAGGALAAGAGAAEMVDGEVRKVDVDNKKMTVRHGEIKNLEMPGMTMVFQVKDPAMLSQVKVGDKIRFAVEKSGGALVITEMQPASAPTN